MMENDGKGEFGEKEVEIHKNGVEKDGEMQGVDVGERWDVQIDEEQWREETIERYERRVTVRDVGKMEEVRQMERDGESCDQSGK